MKIALGERYSALGCVCLNVVCILSKASLHTALVVEEAEALASHGISFRKLEINLYKLGDFKSGVVRKLKPGLAGRRRRARSKS
ncbi:pyruvate/2-oxoglutarate dehydrogenase complex dihydrolipoamide dehydrogenase (E3) component [Paraburkholderia sp. MM5477-R1]